MKYFKIFFAVGIFLILSSTVWADIPKLINFQGILDSAGNPLANRTVSVEFKIYAVPAGGALFWSETQSVTTNAGGVFNVILGTSNPVPDTVFKDTVRYLGIKVGSDAEMTPRQQIVSNAYGYRVSTVDGATGGTISGNVNIQSTLTVDNVVDIGTAVTGGVATVQVGNGLVGFDIAGSPFYGAALVSYDETGTLNAYFGALGASNSGQVFVVDGVTSNYLWMNGGFGGSPYFEGTGAGSYFNLNTDLSGDGAVNLTTDAISSPEMLDEPGVAGNSFDGYAPTGSITPMLSRTITCPSSGYVLAVASCEWDGDHITGTLDFNTAGLSSSSSTIPGDQELAIFVNSALPTGEYLEQLASVELFPVAAGAFTVYYNCVHGLGTTGAFYDINLELLYVPTSYGTVLASAQASLPATALTGTPNQAIAATPTVSLEAERVQSIADNNARIEKELAALKAELEEMKKQLGQPGAPQAPNQQNK